MAGVNVITSLLCCGPFMLKRNRRRTALSISGSDYGNDSTASVQPEEGEDQGRL